jgi:hypothetical protein
MILTQPPFPIIIATGNYRSRSAAQWYYRSLPAWTWQSRLPAETDTGGEYATESDLHPAYGNSIVFKFISFYYIASGFSYAGLGQPAINKKTLRVQGFLSLYHEKCSQDFTAVNSPDSC